MRQNFDSQASIVASIPPRRNNSMKIWTKYLEIAQTRRTFASDLRIKRYNGYISFLFHNGFGFRLVMMYVGSAAMQALHAL